MLSDNPETLTHVTVPTEQATLWHDVVRTTTRTVKHRIFGWHYNKIGSAVKLGITVENRSAAKLEVRHIERALKIVPEDGNWIIDVGQSIAKSCLAGTMERLKPADRHKFGKGTALLEEFELAEGSLAGFIYDLTVEFAGRPRYAGLCDSHRDQQGYADGSAPDSYGCASSRTSTTGASTRGVVLFRNECADARVRGGAERQLSGVCHQKAERRDSCRSAVYRGTQRAGACAR